MPTGCEAGAIQDGTTIVRIQHGGWCIEWFKGIKMVRLVVSCTVVGVSNGSKGSLMVSLVGILHGGWCIEWFKGTTNG